ncbi:N-acetylneuraminate epimerase [Bartonella sp. DGB2]|uniref:N-acetylneuraminate epimerase n=1 Tax=Bartonella sp. DGB2 TaxID=3388426 RepID=UPI003990237E
MNFTFSRQIALGLATVVLSSTTAFAVGAWPDLPVGIKTGISARIDHFAYVGLGSAGDVFYALDLNNPTTGWVKRAAFPGPKTNGAAAAVSDGKIFAFSGNGLATPDAQSPIIFDTVYVYDPVTDSWSKVDTKTPVGLSGAKALSLADGRIAIIGGYNKKLFDKYLSDLAKIDEKKDPKRLKKLVNSYMGMKPKGYHWNARVLSYNPKNNQWGTFGKSPFLPNCDSAIAFEGVDRFMVIGGEIKPGLRTPAVKQVKFTAHDAQWKKLTPLPALSNDEPQEGLAGAFAGKVGDDVLVAGGANFKGAQANAAAGKWFAHDGLPKIWRSEIYVYDNEGWRVVGKLPHGLAYGASFEMPDGLLLVGGEDEQGKASKEVMFLGWDGKTLSISD